MVKPKILMITTNVEAGAGLAAVRHHTALLRNGYESELWYLEGSTSEFGCIKIKTAWLTLTKAVKKRLRKFVTGHLSEKEEGFKSLSIIPSGLIQRINRHNCDIVQLNWVCDFLSIQDIGRISKPIVWRFSDMWPILGTQHYSEYLYKEFQREGGTIYREAQKRTTRVPRRLDRLIWAMKKKNWDRPITICTPSRWLKELTESSALFDKSKVFATGTFIDTEFFSPILKYSARSSIKAPQNIPLIAFGCRNLRDKRKGFDLFIEAIECIDSNISFELLGFGTAVPESICGRRVHNYGRVNNPETLRNIFSAADMCVVPSRQDNLPQLALEAISCGCPVIGFEIAGMTDVVLPGVTGQIAKSVDPESLANAIVFQLTNEKSNELRESCRTYALSNFSSGAVISKYQAAYRQALL